MKLMWFLPVLSGFTHKKKISPTNLEPNENKLEYHSFITGLYKINSLIYCYVTIVSFLVQICLKTNLACQKDKYSSELKTFFRVFHAACFTVNKRPPT